jgi:hypothetical protein
MVLASVSKGFQLLGFAVLLNTTYAYQLNGSSFSIGIFLLHSHDI